MEAQEKGRESVRSPRSKEEKMEEGLLFREAANRERKKATDERTATYKAKQGGYDCW